MRVTSSKTALVIVWRDDDRVEAPTSGDAACSAGCLLVVLVAHLERIVLEPLPRGARALHHDHSRFVAEASHGAGYWRPWYGHGWWARGR